MCNDVLDLAIDILNSVSTEKPKDWLYYIFQYTLGKSFIGAVKIKLNSKYESASLIYLEILRTILKYEEKNKGFDNFSNFIL